MANYREHLAARSIRFWATNMSVNPCWPMTAYNGMVSDPDMHISQAVMRGHPVHNHAWRTIMHNVIDIWPSNHAALNNHALVWALTHFPAQNQLAIAFILTTIGTPVKQSDTIPLDILARLETSLSNLEAALLAKDPQMPQHLRESHRLLISYPETVHLLDDAQIAKLIEAAVVHTNTEIVKATAAKGRKAASKVTVDDL